jgi:orotidine-5'-phosphate decarboxylase
MGLSTKAHARTNTQNLSDRLLVGLDVPTVAEAESLVARLGDTVTFYKIGMQLQFAGGLPFAQELVKRGKKIFLDMKLLDIDATVERAVENIARMGVHFLTVHGEPKAVAAAVRGLGTSSLRILAVTVLTSYDDQDLKALGYQETVAELVRRRAGQAVAAGADGVITSGHEVAALRPLVPPGFKIVVPGIRRESDTANDQKRVATPTSAIAAGADHLVVARPIVAAKDPKGAAEAYLDDIRKALGA